jgi:hypothetical protein
LWATSRQLATSKSAVLPPSTTRLLACRRKGGILVDCVDKQPNLANALTADGIYNRVFTLDFIQLAPETTSLYDRIVMNPPFDHERGREHLMHALKFPNDEGCLIAIMSAGTELRETRKAVAFRALRDRMNAQWRALPTG